MRYLSLCSGIEAATVAWEPLGWTPVAFAEIEKFPSQVLAYHFPEIPNLGDMTKISGGDYAGAVDLLVGGTPCQSFSVAGLRKGLHDPRGGLALVFLEIARDARPEWVLWENVPGVLSSGGGRDFGAFLGALGAVGYEWAYRVLDAQHFGVPQRRRRVFVVGRRSDLCAGDGVHPAQVLSVGESCGRHSAQGRKKGEGSSPRLTGRPYADRGAGDTDNVVVSHPVVGRESGKGYWMEDDKAGALRAEGENRPSRPSNIIVAPPVTASNDPSRSPQSAEVTAQVAAVVHALTKRHDSSEDGTGRGIPLVMAHGQAGAEIVEDGSPTLNCNHEQPVLCVPLNGMTLDKALKDKQTTGIGEDGDPCPTVQSKHQHAVAFTISENSNRGAWENPLSPTLDQKGGGTSSRMYGVRSGMAVRRLTPRECERLQGFPDDYTLVPVGKKLAADGPRYKALGNSMAVPVMRWIGERIAEVAK